MLDQTPVYLDGLARDEAALAKALDTFRAAAATFDMAVHRYAATRTTVTAALGRSPYVEGLVWPQDILEQYDLFPGRGGGGAFRFIGMTAGEAVSALLKESKSALTKEEIREGLREGGYGREVDGMPNVPLRALNAALMKTAGVAKLEDGTYTYQEIVTRADQLESAKEDEVSP